MNILEHKNGQTIFLLSNVLTFIIKLSSVVKKENEGIGYQIRLNTYANEASFQEWTDEKLPQTYYHRPLHQNEMEKEGRKQFPSGCSSPSLC